jgi:hypothetical protein
MTSLMTPVEQRLFLAQAFHGEVAHDEAERCTFERGLQVGRVQEALMAFGGFGRARVLRQALDHA